MMPQRARGDSHIHLFERGISGDTPVGDELRRYAELKEEYGVGIALVVGYEGTPEHAGNNAYIGSLAQQHPWIAPLRFATFESVVTQLDEEFVGYSMYLEDWPVDPRSVSDVFRRLQESSVTASRQRPVVSINANPVALENHASALRQLQECTVMVSHLGLPGRPVPDRATARCVLRPLLDLALDLDVVVKLSGVYAADPDPAGAGAAPYVAELLDTIGPRRLVWGSDFSSVVEASGVVDGFTLRSAVLALFESRDLELLMGENLVRILIEAGFPAKDADSVVSV